MAKREEILTTALDVIARNGYRRTSVRELADAVGLSQAGLLHYFSSKEELFQEVLRKRDEVDGGIAGRIDLDDLPDFDLADGMVAITRHNAEVPGLVQLYTQLSTAATDADHPSHEFFAERYRDFRRMFTLYFERERARTGTAPDIDPAKFATIMAAVMDGLQTQWMLDPSIDMAEHVEYLLDLLLRRQRAAV